MVKALARRHLRCCCFRAVLQAQAQAQAHGSSYGSVSKLAPVPSREGESVPALHPQLFFVSTDLLLVFSSTQSQSTFPFVVFQCFSRTRASASVHHPSRPTAGAPLDTAACSIQGRRRISLVLYCSLSSLRHAHQQSRRHPHPPSTLHPPPSACTIIATPKSSLTLIERHNKGLTNLQFPYHHAPTSSPAHRNKHATTRTPTTLVSPTNPAHDT